MFVFLFLFLTLVVYFPLPLVWPLVRPLVLVLTYLAHQAGHFCMLTPSPPDNSVSSGQTTHDATRCTWRQARTNR